MKNKFENKSKPGGYIFPLYAIGRKSLERLNINIKVKCKIGKKPSLSISISKQKSTRVVLTG